MSQARQTLAARFIQPWLPCTFLAIYMCSFTKCKKAKEWPSRIIQGSAIAKQSIGLLHGGGKMSPICMSQARQTLAVRFIQPWLPCTFLATQVSRPVLAAINSIWEYRYISNFHVRAKAQWQVWVPHLRRGQFPFNAAPLSRGKCHGDF